MTDEKFYEAARDGREASIDFKARVIEVGGKQFEFQFSQMEKELFQYGGIASAFRKFGNRLFEKMMPKNLGNVKDLALQHGKGIANSHPGLQW